MHSGEIDGSPQIGQPGERREGQLALRRLAWLPALLVAVLAAGVAVAGSDPAWRATEPLNISNSSSDSVSRPDIAAGPSGQLMVVWSEERSGNRDIYTVRSYDNGHAWSTPEVVSTTGEDSFVPEILFAGDRAFVTWADGEPSEAIYETEITGGVEVRIVPSPVELVSAKPRLAAGGGRLHAVFHAGSGGNSDILYGSRLLTETTWPTATVVHTHTADGGSHNPVLAVEPVSNSLHLVWEEQALGDVGAVMYMRGTMGTGEVNWTSPITLSAGITQSVWPDIKADSEGNVHIAWGEVRGEMDYVRYMRHNSLSDSWVVSPAARIDPIPVEVNVLSPNDIAPAMAVAEEDGEVTRVCIAWHGFREGESPAEDVLLSCSEDGEHWSTPMNVSRRPENIDENTDIGARPSIEFDGSGTLHTAWEQRVQTHAYYETYYARELVNQVFLPLLTRNY